MEENYYPLNLNTVSKQRRYLTQKIIPFLRTKESGYIKLRRIPDNCRGLWYEDDSCIELDINYNLIPTLIHETVHALNPIMLEKDVVRLEQLLADAMTLNHSKDLLDLISVLSD